MSSYQQLNVSPNAGDVAGSLPVGSITLWSTSTAPTGYLLCDGTAVSRSTYSSLFSVISTTWGAGDGVASAFSSTYNNGVNPERLQIYFTSGVRPSYFTAGTYFTMTGGKSGYSTYSWVVFQINVDSIVALATSSGSPVFFSSGTDSTAGTIALTSPTTFNVPNTSQRVVRGIYPSSYTIATTGGADTITISAANLPAHRHGITSFALSGANGTGGGSIGATAGQYYTAAGQTYTDAATPTAVSNSAIDSRNAYVSIPYIIKY